MFVTEPTAAETQASSVNERGHRVSPVVCDGLTKVSRPLG